MPKIIVTPNLKGGVGKTTTAFNCGAALAAQGHRVLLIDGDGDCCLTDAALGTQPARVTLYDLLADPTQDPASAIVPYTGVPLKGPLHIIPGSERISEAPQAFADSQRARPVASFHKVLPWLIANHFSGYDFIVEDPGPNWDTLTDALMFAASSAIVPLAAEPLAVKGVRRLITRLNKANRLRSEAGIPGVTQVMGLVISKVLLDQREEAQALAGQIDANRLPRFKTIVPYSKPVWEAVGACQPVWAYAPDDDAARAILALTQEIEDRVAAAV